MNILRRASFFKKNISPVTRALLSLFALASLTACTSTGSGQSVQVLSSRGGRIDFLQASRSPVLVVQSKEGMGRARLHIAQPLSEGMTFEFPGLKKLEHFSLVQSDKKTLVCAGTDEAETVCSWGSEWPVALMKRYPEGMTVTVPSRVFSVPGEWRLQWVNYYRN